MSPNAPAGLQIIADVCQYIFFFCETWWLQTLIKAFLVTSVDHKTVVLDKTAKQKCFCHLLHCRGNILVTSASLSLFCTVTASSKGSADAMTVKYTTIPDHTCWNDFLIHHTCRYLHFCGIYSMKYASILRVGEQMTGRSALAPLNLCTHYDIPL